MVLIIDFREEKQQKHKGELVTSHAGALIVETFITHFDTLFDTYDDEDVPELIVKSVDYLLDNGTYLLRRRNYS